MVVVGPFQLNDSILSKRFSHSSRTCSRLCLGTAALLLGIIPRTSSFLTLRNEYTFWELFKHLLFQEAGGDANCFSAGSVGLSGVSWGRSPSRSCVVPLEEQHPDSSGLKKRGQRFLSCWPTTGLTPAGNASAKPHHQTLHHLKKIPGANKTLPDRRPLRHLLILPPVPLHSAVASCHCKAATGGDVSSFCLCNARLWGGCVCVLLFASGFQE